MKKYNLEQFKEEFSAVDFSQNVRNPELYLSDATGLAVSLLTSGGNVDPIITAMVAGTMQIVSGFRRAYCFLNGDKIKWNEEQKNEAGKKEKVEASADFSDSVIRVEHIGELTEAEYFARLCNHTTAKGLDRFGQIQTVERLYRTRRGEHTACRQIERITNLSRAIVSQSIKAIELDIVQDGFLDAYIKGDVKTGDMSKVYPELSKANTESGKVRKVMLEELAKKCKEIAKPIKAQKTEKALSRKEMLALRDELDEKYVGLVEFIAGCKDSSKKEYMK